MSNSDHAIIITPRMILRTFVSEDLDALAKIFANQQVMVWIRGVLSRQQTEQWLEEKVFAHYKKHGYGLYAVVQRTDNALLGFCGLIWQDVEGGAELELGYRFNNQYWGKGLATQAAQAVQKYALNNLGVKRLVCLIQPYNKASVRVGEKCGFVHERMIMRDGLPHAVYVYEK